jgi:hypothetical protein
VDIHVFLTILDIGFRLLSQFSEFDFFFFYVQILLDYGLQSLASLCQWDAIGISICFPISKNFDSGILNSIWSKDCISASFFCSFCFVSCLVMMRLAFYLSDRFEYLISI